MRRNYRVTVRRICAAAALVMVTAWGIPALAPAPAALASPAVASAATRSTAPSLRPRGVDSCIEALVFIYGDENENTFTVACNIPGAVPDGIPGWHWIMAGAQAACGGILVVVAGVGPIIAAGACFDASVSALPFTQQQWCDTNGGTACLNAWSGGPWIDDYTGGPETKDINQEMFLVNENGNTNGSGNNQIVFVGNDSWGGQCIGDADNNSGDADTSLDPCANPYFGTSAGWGTQMTWGTSGCPSGEAWFKDAHWNGYLGPPAGAVNGSHWYLNKPSKVCFAFIIDG